MRILHRPAALLLSALALCAARPSDAQRIDPRRVFDVSVSFEAQMMTSAIREGGALRVVVSETDEYRFMPRAAAGATDRVVMAVYRGAAADTTTRRRVETIEMRVGVPATLRTDPSVSLVIDKVRTTAAPSTVAPVRPVSYAPGDLFRSALGQTSCCVCCGKYCACACGVGMSCGSCCMGGCCPEPQGEPGQEAPVAQPAAMTSLFGGCGAFRAARPAATVIASR